MPIHTRRRRGSAKTKTSRRSRRLSRRLGRRVKTRRGGTTGSLRSGLMRMPTPARTTPSLVGSSGGGPPRVQQSRQGLNSIHANTSFQRQQTRARRQNEEENAARAILKESPDILAYLKEQVEKKKEEMKKIEAAAAAGNLEYEPPTDGDDEGTVIANVQRMLPLKYRSNIRFDVKKIVLMALLLLSAFGGLPVVGARVIKSNVHIPALTERTPEQTGHVDWSKSGREWSWWDWAWVPDPEFTGPPIDLSRDNGAETPWGWTNAISGKIDPTNVRRVYAKRAPERTWSFLTNDDGPHE